MVNSKIEKAVSLFDELEQVFRELTDEDYDIELFKKIDSFLLSILDPTDCSKHPNIASFLLKNKTKSQLLAYIRHVITLNYSFKVSKDGRESYISPDYLQWYDDGVMFLEGQEQFLGLHGLYQNNEAKYAISARDVEVGEILTKKDVEFISIDIIRKLSKTSIPSTTSDLRQPINEMTQMLQDKEKNEHRYQEWIEKYPWILGLQYNQVQRHSHFDDENIPDFTAIRAHDNYRDIIEVKPPFLNLFRQDGDFSSEFNESWNQIERYLVFARENKDYLLRSKGINMENPKCFLIIGYNLTLTERKKLLQKEKFNSAITILTYNDLINYAENTMNIISSIRNSNQNNYPVKELIE